MTIIYSIYNFTIEPYVGMYRQEGYATSTSFGLSLKYNYILTALRSNLSKLIFLKILEINGSYYIILTEKLFYIYMISIQDSM